MRLLDDHEKAIARQLIRNPRATDKSISDATGIQLRTVGRKRQKLEQEGVLRYWTTIDHSPAGTGEYTASHLYVISFAIGVSYQKVWQHLQQRSSQAGRAKFISESHLAEADGKIVLFLLVNGTSDKEILLKMHEQILPDLFDALGATAVKGITTLRLLSPVRTLRNYLPLINMAAPAIRADWPDAAIHVGQ